MNYIDPSTWLLTCVSVSLGLFGVGCWWMMRRIWGEKS